MTSSESATHAGDAPAVLAEDIGHLMGHVAHALGTREMVALHDLGLTLRSYGTLAVVAEAGRTQAEVAAVTGIDRTTMVAIVDDLEARGLLTRSPAPGDRRAHHLQTTEAGTRLAACARDLVRRIEAEALADLTAAERGQLHALLTRLAAGALAAPVDLAHLPMATRRRPSAGRLS